MGLQSDGESQAAYQHAPEGRVCDLVSPSLLKGVSVYYGGETQSTYDNQSFLNGILPEVITSSRRRGAT